MNNYWCNLLLCCFLKGSTCWISQVWSRYLMIFISQCMVMFKSTSHNWWFRILLYHQNVFFVSNRIFFSVRESCDKSDPKQSISFLRYDIVSFHIFYCVNFMFLWMYLDLCLAPFWVFLSVCVFCQRRWLITRKQGNRGDHLHSSLQYWVKRVQIRSFFWSVFSRNWTE